MLSTKNISVLKFFIISLLLVLSVSQIFNTPGSPYLEHFKNYYQTVDNYPSLKYPLGQYKILSWLVDKYDLKSVGLFHTTILWSHFKYLLFGVYLSSLALLLIFHKKLIIKLKRLDIILYYLGSLSLLYFSMSYPYLGVLATPLFLISTALLFKKRYLMSLFTFSCSLLFSVSLTIFLPAFILPFTQSRLGLFKRKKTLAILVIFISFLYATFAKPLSTSSVFNLYSLVKQPIFLFQSYLKYDDWKVTTIITFTSLLAVYLFLHSLYKVSKLVKLLLSIEITTKLVFIFIFSLIFTSFLVNQPHVGFNILFSVIYLGILIRWTKLKQKNQYSYLLLLISLASSYLLLHPFPTDLSLYWLTFLSLLVTLVKPTSFTKTNLLTVNLLVFLNMFLVSGSSGVNPLSGLIYDSFTVLITYVTAFYYLFLSLYLVQTNFDPLSNLTHLKTPTVTLKLICVFALIAVGLAVFTADGSPDTVSWAQYAQASANNPNPFYAQTLVDQRYPPLSTAIISAFANLWKYTLDFSPPKPNQEISQDYAFSTKVSVVVFYFWSIYVFLRFKLAKTKTRKLHQVFIVLTTISLIIQTEGLADLNIHLIPPLLISILLIFKKKYLLAGIWMGVTISIKWQPVILLPLFLATVFDVKKDLKSAVLNTAKFVFGLLPVPIISWLLVYIQPGGKEAFFRAFDYLLHGAPMLSGQALNLNWIVTYLIHIFYPTKDVSLAHLEGLNRQVPTAIAPPIFQGQLFLIAGALILFLYWRYYKKTLNNFLAGAALIFFSHHQLNKSAYEKHIFYVTIFLLLLYLVKPTKGNRTLLTLIDLMTAINLIFFYGIIGAKHFNRMIWGVDLTVIFSGVYLIIFIYVFYLYLVSKGSLFSR